MHNRRHALKQTPSASRCVFQGVRSTHHCDGVSRTRIESPDVGLRRYKVQCKTSYSRCLVGKGQKDEKERRETWLAYVIPTSRPGACRGPLAPRTGVLPPP